MLLTATRTGFYKNQRIRPGQEFEFDENEQVQARNKDTGKPLQKDGKPVMVQMKMPKWAAPKAEALASLAAEKRKQAAQADDLKPIAAQRAGRVKAGQISGESLA